MSEQVEKPGRFVPTLLLGPKYFLFATNAREVFTAMRTIGAARVPMLYNVYSVSPDGSRQLVAQDLELKDAKALTLAMPDPQPQAAS